MKKVEERHFCDWDVVYNLTCGEASIRCRYSEGEGFLLFQNGRHKITWTQYSDAINYYNTIIKNSYGAWRIAQYPPEEQE